MFPDSEIAKRFFCGATKSADLLTFSLHPYFKEELTKDVRKAQCYVVSFDECLNKVTQMEQMDIIVRYWSDPEEKVGVRYFDSEFMGHTQAEKLLEKIKKTLSPLDPKKLLQISMDGPMVNWKFLKMFPKDKSQSDPDAPKLLNLGSCALHVVHGSFQSGEKETGWNVGDVLRALWQLFHDLPVRREDFAEMTKTSTFPLKFCAYRWVEDLAVAERAIEIWPAVQTYINSHRKLPISKVPSSASYCTVKEATADPLFAAKLQFFAFVARWLKPFLEKFQTDAPMVPF
ncbi:AAA ATPase forming ring-shaped complexes [Labeo rohita]|uniref:AAA ATPase forming ring-shaped complexes n=1 Tax=Labeo rohita TaxID=84645 RepID=A0ABQ8M429_LABRO|nr:AAA ATPase forming ring-shaped complexes [Labeo rohita]